MGFLLLPLDGPAVFWFFLWLVQCRTLLGEDLSPGFDTWSALQSREKSVFVCSVTALDLLSKLPWIRPEIMKGLGHCCEASVAKKQKKERSHVGRLLLISGNTLDLPQSASPAQQPWLACRWKGLLSKSEGDPEVIVSIPGPSGRISHKLPCLRIISSTCKSIRSTPHLSLDPSLQLLTTFAMRKFPPLAILNPLCWGLSSLPYSILPSHC